MRADLKKALSGYFVSHLTEHGACARGVGWPSADSQELRFSVLLEGIEFADVPTLLDFGCGYGALAAYLDRHGLACHYQGYDIVPEMVAEAGRLNPARTHRFTALESELVPADHVVASGVFNLKLDTAVATWERHVRTTIEKLWSLARRTVSFNMIPPASSPELVQPELYYADPDPIVTFCEELGGGIEVRRGYGPWEFTIRAWLDSAE